ncbi:MAG: hypothetical protein D6781_07965 [Verrucomicrobia bacterium]|nr:MAG: hypothetical protein D6781_07965 [Verrucomicrobiota bacterium]
MFRPLLSALALASLVPSILVGTEAASDPVGFTRQPLTSGRQTVGVTLNHPTVLSATVAANAADVLMLATAGRTVGERLENGAAYYAEIAEDPAGLFTGDRFEIDVEMTQSIGGDILALRESPHNTLPFPLGDDQLRGCRIIIRRHITLADLFGTGSEASLTAGGDLADADQVLLYDRARAGFDVFFLHRSPTDGTVHWRQAGKPGNFDDTIIPTGTGMFLNRRSDSADAVLTQLGAVRTNDFVMPLSEGYNLVASPFPAASSPADLQMNSANGFASAATADRADRILVFNGNDYTTYFLHRDEQSGAERWCLAGDTSRSFSTAELLAAGRSVFIYKIAADPGFIARRG